MKKAHSPLRPSIIRSLISSKTNSRMLPSGLVKTNMDIQNMIREKWYDEDLKSGKYFRGSKELGRFKAVIKMCMECNHILNVKSYYFKQSENNGAKLKTKVQLYCSIYTTKV